MSPQPSEDLRSRWSGRWHDAEWKPRHRPEGTRGGVGTVAGAPSNERTEWSGNKENVLRERERPRASRPGCPSTKKQKLRRMKTPGGPWTGILHENNADRP